MRTTGIMRTPTDKRKEIRALKHHENCVGVLTGTAVAVVVQMDVDRVTEFTAEFLGLLLSECASGDD